VGIIIQPLIVISENSLSHNVFEVCTKPKYLAQILILYKSIDNKIMLCSKL